MALQNGGKMGTGDWLTALIAGNGALLSSGLAIREFILERRQLKLILRYVAFNEQVDLIVFNKGHRPVTIVDVTFYLPLQGKNLLLGAEPIPRSVLFDSAVDPFPKTLTDGEHVALRLSKVACEKIYQRFFDKTGKLDIRIYDVEGHIYKKYERHI